MNNQAQATSLRQRGGDFSSFGFFLVGFVRWQKSNVLKCAVGFFFFKWHTTTG